MKEALYLLGNMLHELQNTRSCAALFLSSQGQLCEIELKHQFQHYQYATHAVECIFEHWHTKGQLRYISYKKIHQILEQAASTTLGYRSIIINHRCSASEIINVYSHQLINPLLESMVEIALLNPHNDPSSISAYNSFLQWKERTDLERAISTRVLIPSTAKNLEFSERLLFLISEQEAYQRSFLNCANRRQKTLLEVGLQDSGIEELEKIHQALRNGLSSETANRLSTKKWFTLTTKKIELFKQIEETLLDTMEQAPNIETDNRLAKNLINNKKCLQYQYHFLKALPLFSSISDYGLEKLLQHSQIRNYEKGKLLFFEGESSNRLYIILNGWVKIFKGTASGDEAILQILSTGNTLLESSVFLNMPYPVSAQVVENASLLSIPAPYIREQLHSDNDFTLSMLANLSRCSQFLIGEIERTRLKSASERVGWFLLKLLLDQRRTCNSLELPYEKSLIASYLDMKPETFSRTLKKLKEQGFKINNDMITLPSVSALCNFCDTYTASQCERHGTLNCPNPQNVFN